MNENAKKWVSALKTTVLPQGRGGLQTENGYCCLGIACLVYERETGDSLPRDDRGYLDGCTLRYEFEKVREWLGLMHCGGAWRPSNGLSLAILNDVKRLSFKEIAAIIESESNQRYLFGGSVQ